MMTDDKETPLTQDRRGRTRKNR